MSTSNGVAGDFMTRSTAVIEEPAAVENDREQLVEVELPQTKASDGVVKDIWSTLATATIDAGRIDIATVKRGKRRDGRVSGDELRIKEQRAASAASTRISKSAGLHTNEIP